MLNQSKANRSSEAIPMQGMQATSTRRILWVLLVAMTVLSLGVASATTEHSLSNIRFDPDTPATLAFSDRVSFTIDYTTSEPGGVYIWGTPLASGVLPGGTAMHGSVLLPEGHGSLTGWFTIRFGERTVDQLRFQMWDSDRATLLYERFVDVSFVFREGTQPSQPPVAEFTFHPAAPTVHQAVTFDGSGSHAWDGSIRSHAWQFGDGSTASGSTASHIYSSAGTYLVHLTVTDLHGETGTTTQTVRVDPGDDEPTTEAGPQAEAPEEGEHGTGRVVELAYDRGEPDTGRGWALADRGYAVRFTSPSEGSVLLTARLYVTRIVRGPAPIRIHVWDGDQVELIDPFEVTPTEAGWFDVDLSGLNLRPGDADFYVGYTQTQGDRHPFIGLEGAVPAERSYHVPGWSRVTLDGEGGNLMIRVVVRETDPTERLPADDEPTTEAGPQTETSEEGEHGSGRVVELAYDRGEYDTGQGYAVEDRGFAVRFTSPSEGAVLCTARLYVMRIVRGPAPIRIHVWDEDRVELIDPFEVTPTEVGWFDVDLSAMSLRPGDADFYVGYTQTQGDRYPFIGLEGAVPAERSYRVPGWQRMTLDGAGANLMIRVVMWEEALE